MGELILHNQKCTCCRAHCGKVCCFENELKACEAFKGVMCNIIDR